MAYDYTVTTIKTEYTERITPTELERVLQTMGEQGWQLAGVIPLVATDWTGLPITRESRLIFCRPRATAQQAATG